MKPIIILLTAFIFSSCAICRPPRNGAEMEQRVRKHDRRPFTVMQWVKQRSDGYYVVHTIKSNRTRRYDVFECQPDSVQLSKLRDGKPI